MQRTLENCILIKKYVKASIREPQQYYNWNKCMRYARGENDDEPCEQYKNCRMCTCNGLGE